MSLDHRDLYRLPWSLSDNPIAWLEPTQQCNLACDGCYRQNVKEHKPIDEVQQDLDVFERLRNFDGVSIAGGDPLMHPQVVEIVRRVTAMGRKAILNTNGLAMTKQMLIELKEAGLIGLTFHVDSKQGRPGWRNKTEREMNELRQQYADLVHEVGGLACAFNSTVYEDTLDQAPDILDWAKRNMDRVHTVVFILYRSAKQAGFDYYAWGRKVDVDHLVYSEKDEERRTDIKAPEVIDILRRSEPDLVPCAYLNGTEDPTSFKWLVGMRIGNANKTLGWVGPKFMEMVQSAYHFASGRYMSYAPSWTLATGRSVMSSALFVDRGVRTAARNWIRNLARKPLSALEPQYMQAVLIIQPIDVLPDGRASMCDGCPDMTVHEGKLVWSCRLEEQRCWGQWLMAVPKEKAEAAR
ncbi:MAG: radical SAM protein, partial [Sandaracinaceae bacterium]|nr:radical SAM protein [Sandaracinaceae bacterium]